MLKAFEVNLSEDETIVVVGHPNARVDSDGDEITGSRAPPRIGAPRWKVDFDR